MKTKVKGNRKIRKACNVFARYFLERCYNDGAIFRAWVKCSVNGIPKDVVIEVFEESNRIKEVKELMKDLIKAVKAK